MIHIASHQAGLVLRTRCKASVWVLASVVVQFFKYFFVAILGG